VVRYCLWKKIFPQCSPFRCWFSMTRVTLNSVAQLSWIRNGCCAICIRQFSTSVGVCRGARQVYVPVFSGTFPLLLRASRWLITMFCSPWSMSGLLWWRLRRTSRLSIVMRSLFISLQNDRIMGWSKRCILIGHTFCLNWDLWFLWFLNLCDRWHFVFCTLWEQTFIKQCHSSSKDDVVRSTLIRVARGWTWKCAKRETRIKCLGKNPKHLTLTH